jgi:hypothetical protein
MGWKPSFLPNRVLECMNREDRPKGLAGLTNQEAEAKRVFELEIDLHNQFWGFLRRNGFEDVEYSNPRRSTRARRGRPDFLVCRNNRRLGIEFKINPNKLSTDQVKFFEMAQRQGNSCLCCYDYPSAVSAVTEFFNIIAH